MTSIEIQVETGNRPAPCDPSREPDHGQGNIGCREVGIFPVHQGVRRRLGLMVSVEKFHIFVARAFAAMLCWRV